MSDSPASIETVDRGPRVISRATTVDIPADQIFARLQNPRRHHELDGSGTVKDGVSGPENLARGDTFTVSMKQFGLPYRITSRVVDLVPGRAIEWQHPAGYTWRWELDPISETRTRVIETWNYRKARMGWIWKLVGEDRRSARGIESTLVKLQRGFSDRS